MPALHPPERVRHPPPLERVRQLLLAGHVAAAAPTDTTEGTTAPRGTTGTAVHTGGPAMRLAERALALLLRLEGAGLEVLGEARQPGPQAILGAASRVSVCSNYKRAVIIREQLLKCWEI